MAEEPNFEDHRENGARQVGAGQRGPATPPNQIEGLLSQVASALPKGGEKRHGQIEMAIAVSRAFSERRNLVVQAGTGTGKSLAYLVPALRAGRRVVVATATKALQDQLATKDLPFLANLQPEGSFSYAVLKGRSNYLCLQRASETGFAGKKSSAPVLQTLEQSIEEVQEAVVDDVVPDLPGPKLAEQVRWLAEWGQRSESGDRAELDFEPDPRAWAAVSVGPRECPGAFRCPSGGSCFTELARSRAAAADIVVVNTHLYATHVASGGSVLPEHDTVVFDEAHEVEDVMTSGLGVEVTPGRLRALAQSARGAVGRDDAGLVEGLLEVADALETTLRPFVGQRVLSQPEPDVFDVFDPFGEESQVNEAHLVEDGFGEPQGLSLELSSERIDQRPFRSPSTGELQQRAKRTRTRQGSTRSAGGAEIRELLPVLDSRLAALSQALRKAGNPNFGNEDLDASTKRQRALQAATHLTSDIRQFVATDLEQVAWVEGSGPGARQVSLRLAPIDIGPVLEERLWPNVTAVLTSATIPPMAERRLGLPPEKTDRLDVGSPFPYADHSMLYCATKLPDRRSADAEAAIADELQALITAAGGRTLALFTSWRAMTTTCERLREVLDFPIYAQGDLPKQKLLEEFSQNEAACLFATVSFWQGVDIPGRTLSLVALDRLPFARPDDPLFEARRDRAGDRAFSMIDLPRAATLLAQGAGRLIRSADDSGVVAVLDRRLATAGYGRILRAALPPMRWTTDRRIAVEFLEHTTRSETR